MLCYAVLSAQSSALSAPKLRCMYPPVWDSHLLLISQIALESWKEINQPHLGSHIGSPDTLVSDALQDDPVLL